MTGTEAWRLRDSLRGGLRHWAQQPGVANRFGGIVQAVADHLDVGEDWEVQQSRQGLMWSVYRSGFHDEAQARTYARVAADADPEYEFRVVHVLRVRTETTHMEVVVPPTAQMQPVEQP